MQTAVNPTPAYACLPVGSFSIINSAICFKTFETRFLAGLGKANLLRTLEQNRGTFVSGFVLYCLGKQ